MQSTTTDNKQMNFPETNKKTGHETTAHSLENSTLTYQAMQ